METADGGTRAAAGAASAGTAPAGDVSVDGTVGGPIQPLWEALHESGGVAVERESDGGVESTAGEGT